MSILLGRHWEVYGPDFGEGMTGIDDRALYDANYFYRRAYGKDPKREKMYLQEQARIIQHSNFGSVLDVGCGTGEFLDIMDDRFKKFGVEPSEWAAQKCSDRGIEMLRGLHVIGSCSMDVVVFRGTLQHINTPIESLAHASRILKSGGTLAILATPDADSLVYRIFGNLPALDAPRNWVVFGHRELENILKRLGFEHIEISHPYLSTPYARPVKDFLNFLASFFFGWRPFAFPGNQMEIYCRKI
jgi:SAM-dependent methyltransferase